MSVSKKKWETVYLRERPSKVKSRELLWGEALHSTFAALLNLGELEKNRQAIDTTGEEVDALDEPDLE